MARIFFNGVQVGVEISTSKIRHEKNGDKFKNGLSKSGVEYFSFLMIPIKVWQSFVRLSL
jgi:hypothetical protein